MLHPRDVVVYSLTSLSSDDPSGPDQSLADQTSTDQYQLTPAYKNPLTRTACNMTFGPFVQETKKQGKYIYIHVLMRDEKEGRKKQARSNKQLKSKASIYTYMF